jgi:hypothetical protein
MRCLMQSAGLAVSAGDGWRVCCHTLVVSLQMLCCCNWHAPNVPLFCFTLPRLWRALCCSMLCPVHTYGGRW